MAASKQQKSEFLSIRQSYADESGRLNDAFREGASKLNSDTRARLLVFADNNPEIKDEIDKWVHNVLDKKVKRIVGG